MEGTELLSNLLLSRTLLIIFIVLVPPQREGFTTYFRQSVRPHIRTIKISGYGNLGIIRSYKSINPLQLCMDFTGKTTTNENS